MRGEPPRGLGAEGARSEVHFKGLVVAAVQGEAREGACAASFQGPEGPRGVAWIPG